MSCLSTQYIYKGVYLHKKNTQWARKIDWMARRMCTIWQMSVVLNGVSNRRKSTKIDKIRVGWDDVYWLHEWCILPPMDVRASARISKETKDAVENTKYRLVDRRQICRHGHWIPTEPQKEYKREVCDFIVFIAYKIHLWVMSIYVVADCIFAH